VQVHSEREGGGRSAPRATGAPWFFLGGGVFHASVPRVANYSGARGSRTRESCRGDGGAAVCERRGAPMRIALSGRGRRRASLASGEASGGAGVKIAGRVWGPARDPRDG
jgi:hypothetical protein